MNLSKELSIDQIENKNLLKVKLESIKLGTMLRRSNFRKQCAETYSIQRLLYRIMVIMFMDKPMRALWESSNMLADCLKGAGKDCYYRLLKNERSNWRNLLLMVTKKLLRPLEKLTPRQERVLILDDTPNKKRGKDIELLSWHYDHSTHTHYKGFTQVHLGWSDGNSYLPMDFCPKVSPDRRTNTREKKIDQRTCGAQRRKESFETKLEQGLKMLSRCYAAGVDVGYVVYDSWFAKPSFIKSVFDIGYQTVCQLVRNDKIWHVTYLEKTWTLKALYRHLQETKSFSKMTIGNIQQYVASIVVQHANGLELKLLFCKTGRKKEWIVIASTDAAQSNRHVLETYAKRWDIEQFFKDSKQLLKLGKEQSIDFDVQIAMTTIRLMTYAIGSSMRRELLDERTFGELFELLENQFSRLNLDRDILSLIFNYVLESLSTLAKKKVMTELQVIFDCLLEDFASNGLIREKKKVA